MYFYLKAFHIIFVVTWFAGMFYIVRLFIYNTEAQAKAEPERAILTNQFQIMIRRLWLGITWPSAIATAVFGPWIMYHIGWHRTLLVDAGTWLLVKLFFVLLLFGYHYTLHKIYREQMKGVYRYTSQQLRIWNEVATVFLVAIVMLATVKTGLSFMWGLLWLAALTFILMAGIRLYKQWRK